MNSSYYGQLSKKKGMPLSWFRDQKQNKGEDDKKFRKRMLERFKGYSTAKRYTFWRKHIRGMAAGLSTAKRCGVTGKWIETNCGRVFKKKAKIQEIKELLKERGKGINCIGKKWLEDQGCWKVGIDKAIEMNKKRAYERRRRIFLQQQTVGSAEERRWDRIQEKIIRTAKQQGEHVPKKKPYSPKITPSKPIPLKKGSAKGGNLKKSNTSIMVVPTKKVTVVSKKVVAPAKKITVPKKKTTKASQKTTIDDELNKRYIHLMKASTDNWPTISKWWNDVAILRAFDNKNVEAWMQSILHFEEILYRTDPDLFFWGKGSSIKRKLTPTEQKDIIGIVQGLYNEGRFIRIENEEKDINHLVNISDTLRTKWGLQKLNLGPVKKVVLPPSGLPPLTQKKNPGPPKKVVMNKGKVGKDVDIELPRILALIYDPSKWKSLNEWWKELADLMILTEGIVGYENVHDSVDFIGTWTQDIDKELFQNVDGLRKLTYDEQKMIIQLLGEELKEKIHGRTAVQSEKRLKEMSQRLRSTFKLGPKK